MRVLRWMILAVLATQAIAMQARATEKPAACAPRNLASLSGWSGVWIAEGMQAELSGRVEPGGTADLKLAEMMGFTAPWNDAGILRFENRLWGSIDGRRKQAGWAFPMMMNTFAPLTFIVAPQVTVIVSQYREVRYVYTDGRPHPSADDLWPTPWGDSIGCWKGGTLTIDTVGVGYNPQVNHIAPALSEDARFVEKIRLVAAGRMESELTITDPATLAQPWKIHIVYVRPQNLDRLIHDGDMFDNDRSVTDGDSPTIAPPRQEEPSPPPLRPEVKPGAAHLDRLAGDYVSEAPRTVLHVVRRGDYLWIAPDGRFALPFHAVDPLNFYARPLDIQMRFLTDTAGNVVGLESRGPEGLVSARKLASATPAGRKE